MSTAAPTTMQVEREDLNPCTVLLKVTCSPEQVKTGVRRAIKALAKRIKVPGFRQGAAPAKMIEQILPEGEILAKAQEETVGASFKKAIEGEGIEVGGQAQIENVKFDRDASACTYTVQVPLPPQVELGDYKGLQADRIKVEVSEDEVDRQVEELLSRSGTKQAVDRGVQDGDNALVNIKPEGEEGDGRNFMVVAGQTFDDLDKALGGMKTDDIKSVTLDFPDPFQEKDLAGRSVKCTVTVRSVSAIQVPELDDDFAKSMNVESAAELKNRIRGNIRQAKEQMAQDMLHERLMQQLQAASTVHVADNTWQSVAERRLAEIGQELEQQNSSLEEYAKQNGMTEKEFVQAQRDEAKTQVERALLIEHVFKDEGVQISDADAHEHFLKIAWENKVQEDDLKKFAKKNGPQLRDEVIYRTMYAKVMALLAENAEITEIDPPDAGPGQPARKAPQPVENDRKEPEASAGRSDSNSP
ncbi:MAG: trigger factor [Armatimonadetes bacterium]|nr:trigger factor [Armatimonadota bacterium]